VQLYTSQHPAWDSSMATYACKLMPTFVYTHTHNPTPTHTHQASKAHSHLSINETDTRMHTPLLSSDAVPFMG